MDFVLAMVAKKGHQVWLITPARLLKIFTVTKQHYVIAARIVRHNVRMKSNAAK